MANALGNYKPEFYANEALIQLEKALGMAGRVHRGFERERESFNKGEYINIRRPSTFAAQDAPGTAEDLQTETVAIQLAYWRTVKFKLSDKEQAFTGDEIIEEHIRPAAYVLADDIDQKLVALYKDVPWQAEWNAAGSLAVADIANTRKIMRDNKVPLDDPTKLHLMIDSGAEAEFLALSAFSQHQGAGDAGVNTQLRGSLGTKFGLEVFANQNVLTHAGGTCADAAGAVDLGAGYAIGDTTIHIDGVTDGGDWHAGDHFVTDQGTQRYAVTSDVTFTGGEGDVSFYPPLKTALSDGDVVTGTVDTSGRVNLAFHQHAFALAMAPLPTVGRELGAKIWTASDPKTGLAIRARMYYVGNSSEVHVALDTLYGVRTLDPNLAVRGLID